MNENNKFLGLVQNGQFRILMPETADLGPNRLTTIQMHESRPPESGELSLREAHVGERRVCIEHLAAPVGSAMGDGVGHGAQTAALGDLDGRLRKPAR